MAIYYVETTIPSFYHEVRTEPEMVARKDCVLHRAEWYRAKSVKAVGFELDFPRCEDPLGTRIHENDGRIIILTIIRFLTVNRLISGGVHCFFPRVRVRICDGF